MCARNYFRYLRIIWITLLFIKRKLGGDVSSCCQGCGLLCVLVSRDVSRHSTEQLSSHRHRQVVGPLPRIPSFTINKDPEICDPESHKTRDLERLIVSSQGGVSNTVVFLRDISRGKLTTSPNPDASSTKSAAATSPTFCCCRRMPSCGMPPCTLFTWMAQPPTICPSPSPTRSFLAQCSRQG